MKYKVADPNKLILFSLMIIATAAFVLTGHAEAKDVLVLYGTVAGYVIGNGAKNAIDSMRIPPKESV